MDQHPDAETLRAYAQGRLPIDRASKLDSHIEQCDLCAKALGEVASDTYCDLLRQPQTAAGAPTARPSSEIPPELQNHPRYEIGDRLGHGGMGVVFRAVHRMMGRPVALKLIRPDLLAAPAAVERFRREVQAAARLTHPNIVTAHDAEEVSGVHFLVMEFVEGKTLDQVVGKRGPLSAPVACHLIRQAALGLDHAHSHGMVHRDIKPQNLIVTAKSKVKILDFGLAMWSGPESSAVPRSQAETSALGTRLYAAPEQFLARSEVDARADQFGLGATLYYLLTGQPPRSETEPLTKNQFNFDETHWLFPESVPQGVRDIVKKLMAPDANDRYGSAKQVAEALLPWCGTQPVEAKSRLPYRQIAMAAITLVVIVGITLSAYAIYQGRKTDAPPLVSSTQDQNKGRINIVTPTVLSDKDQQEGWESLLKGFEPTRHAVVGNWRKVQGELLVDAFTGGRIALPAPTAPQYDLRFSFTRKTGKHSIGAIVIVGGRPVGFEVDAWEQHLAGIQDINGQTMIQNSTRRDNYQLENGRRYTINIEVRQGGLRCYLDGQLVTCYKTDGRDLSVNQKYWAMPDPSKMALLAWDSATVFHSVDIRYSHLN